MKVEEKTKEQLLAEPKGLQGRFGEQYSLFMPALLFSLIFLIGWLDYITGPEISFSIFYLLPISAVAWLIGKNPGLLAALFGALTWLVAERMWHIEYSHAVTPHWNASVRLLIFLAIASLLSTLKELYEGLERTVKERTLDLTKEIEDHKKSEEEIIRLNADLQESAERFRAVAETAADAIICINTTDSISLWNKKAEEMFGFTVEEAIGKGLHEVIVPEKYREKAYKGLDLFFKTGEGQAVGKTVELTALKKDGTEFPVELSISAMKIKNEWHSTGIVRDITERKLAEETLKQRLDELMRFEKATVQREFRMRDLKEENERLKERIGEMEGKLQKTKDAPA